MLPKYVTLTPDWEIWKRITNLKLFNIHILTGHALTGTILFPSKWFIKPALKLTWKSSSHTTFTIILWHFDCMFLSCHVCVRPVWLDGWVFVYKLSGCEFESHCDIFFAFFSFLSVFFFSSIASIIYDTYWHLTHIHLKDSHIPFSYIVITSSH